MLTSELDYTLPEELIAQQPLEQRDSARLLVVNKETGRCDDRIFADMPELLWPNDLLVLNNTRVTARRLKGRKESGVAAEVLVLKEHRDGVVEGLVKPGRRLLPGAMVHFAGGASAIVCKSTDYGGRLLQFQGLNDGEVSAFVRSAGTVPLPPYIHTELANPARYDTVYASVGGSAAAPTAGLHFTEEMLARLADLGIAVRYVTLDVGLDTFRPVRAERVEDHEIHGELFVIPEETARAVRECTGRVIAVGTTSCRAIETASIGPREVRPGPGGSRLFVTPGFQFQTVDGLLTNFHLPRTTMLAMVSALAGTAATLAAYRHAVSQRYRFLSFGDAMAILPDARVERGLER